MKTKYLWLIEKKFEFSYIKRILYYSTNKSLYKLEYYITIIFYKLRASKYQGRDRYSNLMWKLIFKSD
jgi:hypothetical protein